MERLEKWRGHAIQAIRRIQQSPPGQFVEKRAADNASTYATVIAYNAILSMFPIVLALLAIAGVFVRDERSLEAIKQAIVMVLPSDVEEDALIVVEASRTGSGLFGIVGFLGLLWGGSALFGAMADGFNRVFAVQGRGFVRQKLMAMGMIFVFAVTMLLSIAATSLATLLLTVSLDAVPFQVPRLGLLESMFAWLTSLAMAFLLFMSIYWIVPNRPFSFAQVWPGAALGSILFFLIMQVWPLYAANFGRFSRFGALFGLFFLIMTWFYFLAQIVMLGAELNAFLLRRRGDP